MTDLYPAASVAAMAHAETEYPNESVGIVTLDGEYVPLVNTHPEPDQYFDISDDDLEEHVGNIACVIHSHCYRSGEVDPALIGPSRADQIQRQEWGCPWGLVPCIDRRAEVPLYWGEFRLDEPLIARRFIPQVTDCYELIRSAYWQWYAIRLPEFPRDWDWWKTGENLYEQGFTEAGFRALDDLNDYAPGDVLLARADAEAHVVNHAAVALAGGRILHHRPNRLSERISAGVWQRGNFFTRALRHSSFGDGPPPPPRDDSIF